MRQFSLIASKNLSHYLIFQHHLVVKLVTELAKPFLPFHNNRNLTIIYIHLFHKNLEKRLTAHRSLLMLLLLLLLMKLTGAVVGVVCGGAGDVEAVEVAGELVGIGGGVELVGFVVADEGALVESDRLEQRPRVRRSHHRRRFPRVHLVL